MSALRTALMVGFDSVTIHFPGYTGEPVGEVVMRIAWQEGAS